MYCDREHPLHQISKRAIDAFGDDASSGIHTPQKQIKPRDTFETPVIDWPLTP